MINEKKFLELNPKQQIYKVAGMLRKLEEAAALGDKEDYTVAMTYISYIRRCAGNARTDNALQTIDSYLAGIETLEDRSERVKRLNLCFHDLLQVLEEPIGEHFYEVHPVKRFDKDSPVRHFNTAAILDNLRSPFNVGSIFRTSDAFGVGELALCGITPRPGIVNKVGRTAMGTENIVKWTGYERARDAIEHYRALGYHIFALETTGNARSLSETTATELDQTAYVFGNEEFGMTDETISLCDGVIEIPLVGVKNSINVANAYAVVMYEVMKKLGE